MNLIVNRAAVLPVLLLISWFVARPGTLLHLAARHPGGEWLMVYLGDTASFSVNMNKLSAARVRACWIDPRTGEESPIGVLGNTGVKTLTTPTGWEDALLVLEAAKKIY